jgi:hypothetical protein
VTDRLDYALRYAARGFAVVPLFGVVDGRCTCGEAACRSPGKHPLRDLVPHGVHDASSNPSIIAGWFAARPEANIGIATGAASGFDALDIDPRNGGLETLEDLTARRGKLPDTCMQLTGGGGQHYLFAHEPGRRPKSPGKGIDVKSTGGLIVVEPSSHVSGSSYQWEASSDPLEGLSIAPWPHWLTEPAPVIVRSSGGGGYMHPQRISDLRAALAHIDPTPYNSWIQVGQALHSSEAPEAFDLWDQWSARASNYQQGETAQKWRTFNAGGALHVESIFVWARDAGWDGSSPQVAVPASQVQVAKPRAEDVPPIEILEVPGALGEFVRWANRTAPKPQPQFAVQAAIALGAVVLGRRWRTTHDNYASLYLLNVGRSGSGKEHARTVLEKVLSAAQLAHLIGPTSYTSDSAVFDKLLESPSHIAIIDEIGSMLGNSKAQGNFHRRQSLDALVSAWGLLHGTLRPQAYANSSATASKRKEMAKRVVHRPAISLLGMSTPRTLYANLNEQAIEGGFLNRLIIVESMIGPQLRGVAEQSEPPGSVVGWCHAARDAVGTGNLSNVDLGADVIPDSRVVPFDPEAERVFRRYEEECISSMLVLEAEGLAEMETRSVEKAMRLALIAAVSTNVVAPRVDTDIATWAIRYVRYYTAQTIAALRRHMHGSLFGQWRAALLEAIQKGGAKGCTERELAKKSRVYTSLEPRQRRAVLDALKADGLVEYVDQGQGYAGRGKSRVAWVALDDTPNDDNDDPNDKTVIGRAVAGL